ncbi:unnamed protein product [Caenorhabditis auriculariae]|uniref:RING-type domain-containing protein n=1 Tax=Caenorhabditis auriculariae TaxID=2777116 RepID=A0A8S1GNW4_9PELO|nr:unnamed protein product [Caenorhabditis auriculariae]
MRDGAEKNARSRRDKCEIAPTKKRDVCELVNVPPPTSRLSPLKSTIDRLCSTSLYVFRRKTIDKKKRIPSERQRSFSRSSINGPGDPKIKFMKEVAGNVLETVLRLPGLILLELWWRNHDMTFEEISQEMMNKAPFNSYFDTSTILDFVHRRNFDHSAAIILSHSVVVFSLMFLTLPLSRLFRMYSHALSLALFALAHYMSVTYVSLEMKSGDKELHLDDFIKLERHGFHFLAQMLVAVLQSFVLELETERWRIFLAMFSIPIVSRMCACPLEKLIIAHNISCCVAMVFICMYVLYRVPSILKSIRIAWVQMKAIFVIRGLAMGCATLWRRLRIAELLTFTWLTLFFLRLYVELYERRRPLVEAGKVLLAGVAESTNTPISLLSLAITISFVCKWVVDGAQLMIGGRREHGNVLVSSGCNYTGAVSLVLLCTQAGIFGMGPEQKTFLMGLTLFIVLGALLQSMQELLEPELLMLASSPFLNRGRQVRCLSLAAFLVIAPLVMSYSIILLLSIDIWCVILISNAVMTSIYAISALIQYGISVFESRSKGSWERVDDVTFYLNCGTRGIELLIAKIVALYGMLYVFHNKFPFSATFILVFHIVVNIYKRLANLLRAINARDVAVKKTSRLPKASLEQLKKLNDVCAICFIAMKDDVRITPCRHFFHGTCLRKWFAVKQVCPLCYSDFQIDTNRVRLPSSRDELFTENTENVVEGNKNVYIYRRGAWQREQGTSTARQRLREEHRVHNARDMWPLVVDSEAYESDSSATTEYSVDSSDSPLL